MSPIDEASPLFLGLLDDVGHELTSLTAPGYARIACTTPFAVSAEGGTLVFRNLRPLAWPPAQADWVVVRAVGYYEQLTGGEPFRVRELAPSQRGWVLRPSYMWIGVGAIQFTIDDFTTSGAWEGATDGGTQP